MIYEIMYIIPSKYSDSEIEGITETVNGLYKKHGAEVKETRNLGKLKFAYTIKGFTHGTYILSFVEAEGDAVAKIDQELRLADEVLRHITVKREKGIPEYDITLVQYQDPITPTGKRIGHEDAPEAKATNAVDEPSDINLDEINEKLDEMLEDDTVEA